MITNKNITVGEYIQSFPSETQLYLTQIRKAIKDIAPDAVENISYGMPAYKTYGKPLIYFAGYKNHIGLYATPSGHQAFKEELSKYKQGKGSVQFPLEESLPLNLIKKIIKFKVKENRQKYGRL